MNIVELREFGIGYALGSLLIFVPYFCYSYGYNRGRSVGYDLAVKDYKRIVKGE